MNETIKHSNVWGFAAIMIVVASWVLYRYLAPKTWREWAGTGLEGWRELYRAQKENRLATSGLYALVRHPQYTGLFIGLFGEGVVHWPTLLRVRSGPECARRWCAALICGPPFNFRCPASSSNCTAVSAASRRF